MEWTPGYPLLMALGLLLGFTNLMLWAGIVQAFFIALLAIPIWFLARLVLPKRWALPTALMTSFYPTFFVLFPRIMPEPSCTLLVTSGLGLILCSTSRIRQTLGGVLLGLAVLFRPEFLSYALVLVAWLTIRKQFRSVGLILLALGLVLSPWIIRNMELSGHLVLSTRAPRVIFEQNEGYLLAARQGLNREEVFARYPLSSADYTRSQQLKMIFLQWVHSHPKEYTELCVKRVASMVTPFFVKDYLMQRAGLRNVVAENLSYHFRYAELSFQILFWLLALPGIVILLWKSRKSLRSLFLAPQGLLLLFCLLQVGVSFFLVYASYQRSTLDMVWLLAGLSGWAMLKKARGTN